MFHSPKFLEDQNKKTRITKAVISFFFRSSPESRDAEEKNIAGHHIYWSSNPVNILGNDAATVRVFLYPHIFSNVFLLRPVPPPFTRYVKFLISLPHYSPYAPPWDHPFLILKLNTLTASDVNGPATLTSPLLLVLLLREPFSSCYTQILVRPVAVLV